MIHVRDLPRRAVGEIVILGVTNTTATGMVVFAHGRRACRRWRGIGPAEQLSLCIQTLSSPRPGTGNRPRFFIFCLCALTCRTQFRGWMQTPDQSEGTVWAQNNRGKLKVLFSEYFCRECFDGCSRLPGVWRESGFAAGLLQEGDAIPVMLDGDLRKQKPAADMHADQKAVASDLNRLRPRSACGGERMLSSICRCAQLLRELRDRSGCLRRQQREQSRQRRGTRN